MTTDTKATSVASNIPSEVLVHMMHFMYDNIQFMTRVPQVCRHWNSNHPTINKLWQKAYYREWEWDSVEDSCITASQLKPTWKSRYKQRHQVEQNWRDLRCSMIRFALPFPDDTVLYVPDTAELLPNGMLAVGHAERARRSIFERSCQISCVSIHSDHLSIMLNDKYIYEFEFDAKESRSTFITRTFNPNVEYIDDICSIRRHEVFFLRRRRAMTNVVVILKVCLRNLCTHKDRYFLHGYGSDPTIDWQARVYVTCWDHSIHMVDLDTGDVKRIIQVSNISHRHLHTNFSVSSAARTVVFEDLSDDLSEEHVNMTMVDLVKNTRRDIPVPSKHHLRRMIRRNKLLLNLHTQQSLVVESFDDNGVRSSRVAATWKQFKMPVRVAADWRRLVQVESSGIVRILDFGLNQLDAKRNVHPDHKAIHLPCKEVFPVASWEIFQNGRRLIVNYLDRLDEQDSSSSQIPWIVDCMQPKLWFYTDKSSDAFRQQENWRRIHHVKQCTLFETLHQQVHDLSKHDFCQQLQATVNGSAFRIPNSCPLHHRIVVYFRENVLFIGGPSFLDDWIYSLWKS
jgi:hypothetical protein